MEAHTSLNSTALVVSRQTDSTSGMGQGVCEVNEKVHSFLPPKVITIHDPRLFQCNKCRFHETQPVWGSLPPPEISHLQNPVAHSQVIGGLQ